MRADEPLVALLFVREGNRLGVCVEGFGECLDGFCGFDFLFN